MVREIISINIGQCGINLGLSIWQQYCVEHEIDTKGNRNRKSGDDDTTFTTFFEQTESGKYRARNLMIDTDPDSIDYVKHSRYRDIYDPEYLVSGKQSASKNFARGHYSIGKEMIDTINDRIRKLVDNCDNIQGFIINHSVGGGTGSGLASLILERVAVDYRKKSKVLSVHTLYRIGIDSILYVDRI